MPVGDVLVGDAGSNIEHDDTALAVDVVSITETSKLLLSCSVPDIELNVAQVLCDVSRAKAHSSKQTYRAESEGVNLNTKGCNVFLLELSGQMALDKSGLSGISV